MPSACNGATVLVGERKTVSPLSLGDFCSSGKIEAEEAKISAQDERSSSEEAQFDDETKQGVGAGRGVDDAVLPQEGASEHPAGATKISQQVPEDEQEAEGVDDAVLPQEGASEHPAGATKLEAAAVQAMSDMPRRSRVRRAKRITAMCDEMEVLDLPSLRKFVKGLMLRDVAHLEEKLSLKIAKTANGDRPIRLSYRRQRIAWVIFHQLGDMNSYR